jgi:capsular exopolysaccharide synthesis family protein
LAHTIAQSGRWVIVVDADVRRPSMHKIFDVPNKIGLSSILRQQSIPEDRNALLSGQPGQHLNSILRREVTLDEAVQHTKMPGVWVLTSGPVLPNPSEWLGSPHMTALLEKLTERFDMVLLDTPALLAVTDAAVLAPAVDAVLLVVGRNKAREETVQAACRQLDKVNARSVGLVINRAEQDGRYAYYAEAEKVA